MRFGKQRKWGVAAKRRLFGSSQEEQGGSVATEERSALLEEEDTAPAPEETREAAPALAGDPTQHLLTALGRFHRQVVKANSAASSEDWCDECMDQIIAGIEIAIGQEWEDVQEALTGAARLLESYEEGGRVEDCLPFLQDGYEILCLMVGDLIVDNVRSGVMDKWRIRYEIAVEELLKSGLELVQDEEMAATEAEVFEEAERAPQMDEVESVPDSEETAEEPESMESSVGQVISTVSGDLLWRA